LQVGSLFCYNIRMEKVKLAEKQSIFKKIMFAYREIPNKKPYVEFLTALLSIPVLLTVILLNINNLKGQDKKAETTAPGQVIITVPVKETPINPSQEACKPEIGDIAITSPDEHETITDNPVSVTITSDDKTYCSVVWSYRINGGRWSEYDDKSVALYDLPNGEITFELHVKSIVNSATKDLKRTFIYKGKTSNQTATASAN
jgi:hypothetical protein